MTWDIALRPFFVVVPVLVLMVLARWEVRTHAAGPRPGCELAWS